MEDFLVELSKADHFDKELFYELFVQGMELLQLSVEDISLELDVSRVTINHWKNKRNAPHPLMRKSVYCWLIEKINETNP